MTFDSPRALQQGGRAMTLELCPMTLREARAFVDRLHRHHPAPQGGLFAIGCARGVRRERVRDEPSVSQIAVEQVRRWGGVLEHPEGSVLWLAARLPLPGGLPDEHGGWSIEVDQVSWGHRARKRTWLYVVGVRPSDIVILRGGTPTHRIAVDRRKPNRSGLKELSAQGRRRTPRAFAEFLVAIARGCRRVD
jgi:hypothetical protein